MPKSPKVPTPPDVAATTAAATASNKDTLLTTAAIQAANQNTPLGSLSYTLGTDANGNPVYTADTKLSPEQQALLNQLQSSQYGLGQAGGNLVNDASAMYSEAPDFSETAGTQTRINMERNLGYLNPFFTQQTDQLDNQLRNQGLMPGTEAYKRATRSLQDNQNQSVMKFLNDTQSQSFDQAQKQYNQPIDTISKILGLSQPGSLSNSLVKTPTPTMGNVDVAGITKSNYDQQLEAYKAKLAQSNSMMSGLFGIGTSLLTGGMGGPLMSGLGGMIGNAMIPGYPGS